MEATERTDGCMRESSSAQGQDHGGSGSPQQTPPAHPRSPVSSERTPYAHSRLLPSMNTTAPTWVARFSQQTPPHPSQWMLPHGLQHFFHAPPDSCIGNKVFRPSDSVLRLPNWPLRDCMSKVSIFDFSRLTDASKFDCGSSASTVRYTNSVARPWRFVGWLRRHWFRVVVSSQFCIMAHVLSLPLIVLSMSPHRSPSLPPAMLPLMLAASLSSSPTPLHLVQWQSFSFACLGLWSRWVHLPSRWTHPLGSCSFRLCLPVFSCSWSTCVEFRCHVDRPALPSWLWAFLVDFGDPLAFRCRWVLPQVCGYPDRDLNCLLGRYRIYCLLL